PHSFTGENVVELHCHGSRAVVLSLIRAATGIEGVRLAIAGEFTRRAFENGKLDLAAIEGLADLLEAETEAQRKQAFAQFSGLLGAATERLRGPLIEALALIEASIDFADEDDVLERAVPAVLAMVDSAAKEINDLLTEADRGEMVRAGLIIAIAGPPNAGKSTLMNALAKRDVAIVSPVAGTTRDLLEVRLDLGGVAAILVDMAGLRESADPIEQEGVRRARARLGDADLVLWLSEAGEEPEGLLQPGKAVWRVKTKVDLSPEVKPGWMALSVLRGDELSGLVDKLVEFARDQVAGEPPILVRERHRVVFAEILRSLNEARAVSDWVAEPEIVAEHIRHAVYALGRATGRVGVEEVLDVVFSSFCIGK
ncbi:MAG: tRNA uridine-5-carboxymethylaminomethyl(34) synthesis GTPase MnmE, partial [Alphaproteobacteria bacterium]